MLLDVSAQCDGDLHPVMDLKSAIAEAVVAMDLFFNNRFAESKIIYQKWYEECCFQSLCFLVVLSV